jgi:hypothetical protein
VAPTSLSMNGRTVSVTVDDPDTPLLYVLRNEIGLLSPRFGCGLGQCGACTVLIDGEAVRSCVTPLSAVTGKVVTLEGLGTDMNPHPIQQAFIAEQAVHDHAIRRPAEAQPAPNRTTGQIRAGEQSLPLRHASAHRTRGDACRRRLGGAER